MFNCLQLKLANVNLEYNLHLSNGGSLNYKIIALSFLTRMMILQTVNYKVTRHGYSVGLCCIEFPNPKINGNKKVHRCSLSTIRDWTGPIQGHVALTYMVTHQGYSVGSGCIEFPEPKNKETKKRSWAKWTDFCEKHVIESNAAAAALQGYHAISRCDCTGSLAGEEKLLLWKPFTECTRDNTSGTRTTTSGTRYVLVIAYPVPIGALYLLVVGVH